MLADWLAALGLPGAELSRTRSEAVLFSDDRHVLKIHRPGTVPGELARRLAAAAQTEELLSPVLEDPIALPSGLVQRLNSGAHASLWPRVEPLSQDPVRSLPWAQAGQLLSQLHVRPPGVVPAGGVSRAERALAWLEHTEQVEAEIVRAAADTLPDPRQTFAGSSLIHGDWHFGQLGRTVDGDWRLLDVDELGSGAPLSDLGRVAALYAIGVVEPAQWEDFVDGYRSGPSSALGATGPVWPAVDLQARWAVVIATVGLLRQVPAAVRNPDEPLTEFLQACHRMASA